MRGHLVLIELSLPVINYIWILILLNPHKDENWAELHRQKRTPGAEGGKEYKESTQTNSSRQDVFFSTAGHIQVKGID